MSGERLYRDSVEEIILHQGLSPIFRPAAHKFSSAGREDVDVLMLGRGRPFYFELNDPKRTTVSAEELRECEARVNAFRQEVTDGDVAASFFVAGDSQPYGDSVVMIRDLQIVRKSELKILKDSAHTKQKSYSTLVRMSDRVDESVLKRVNAMTDIQLKQQTPVRVSERRADLVREKIIHKLHVYPVSIANAAVKQAPLEENSATTSATSPAVTTTSTTATTSTTTTTSPQFYYRVDLTTSAGTYVKEFVHGDGGRTLPNLTSLLEIKEAWVEALDVAEVHLDWPPPCSAHTVRQGE